MKKKKIISTLMFCFLLVVSIFVYHGEAKAAGNYTLQINKGTNVVTVFRSDGTPERAFICSTGNATPVGTYNTSQKLRWHVLDGPSYGQYCTRITGSYLFHSVWYYRYGDYSSQSYREYNKLGTTASHGCVRLTVADAKWIYDNCPIGTTVRIFYGSSANDPLGKPMAIKVPNVREGWDPTDPAPGNPYSSKMPSINTSGAVTQIAYGSQFNPFVGITAKDSLGNDITSSLSYAGTVDTHRLGSYQVTYRVTDALGRMAYADVIYNVVDTQPATISGVKKSQTKEYNSTIELRENIRAYNATGQDLTGNLQISVTTPDSGEQPYADSTLKLNKLGTYYIYYSVTNPNNNIITKVTSKVTVKDTKKPKLSGVTSKKVVEYNSVKNLKSKITAKLVSGENVTSKIGVRIKLPKEKTYKKLSSKKYTKYKFTKIGNYRVEYSITNPYNKKAVTKKVTIYTVKDTKKPNISGVKTKKTLEYNSVQNLKSGITAKLVSGKNMTSSIVIKVKVPKATKFKKLSEKAYKKYKFSKLGTYTVEYSVANPNNKKAIAKKTMKVTIKDTKPPVIRGVKNKTIEYNQLLSLRSGVTAKLVSGKNVTSSMKIKLTTPEKVTIDVTKNKNYRFKKMGTYTVEYSVANPNNKKAIAKKTMKVTVEDTKAPVIRGVKNKTIEYNQLLSLRSGVTAKLVSGQDITSNMKITLTTPEQVKTDVTKNKNYRFKQTGIYTLEYSATNPNNNKATAKKVIKITVKDTKAPVINGVKDKTVSYGETLNLWNGITARLVSGEDITSNIKITVTTPEKVTTVFTESEYTFSQAGVYTVTYSAMNPTNKKETLVEMKVTVNADERVPVITIDESKTKTVEINKSYDVLEGVTAVLGQEKFTDGITTQVLDESGKEIAISEEGKVTFATKGTYKIIYTVVNPNNKTLVGTAEFILEVIQPEVNQEVQNIEDTTEKTTEDIQNNHSMELIDQEEDKPEDMVEDSDNLNESGDDSKVSNESEDDSKISNESEDDSKVSNESNESEDDSKISNESEDDSKVSNESNESEDDSKISNESEDDNSESNEESKIIDKNESEIPEVEDESKVE